MFFVGVAADRSHALAWLEQRLDDVRSSFPAPRALSSFEVTLSHRVEHEPEESRTAEKRKSRLSGFP